MDKVLTIQEVAEYLKVSRTTVWRWCDEGKLPAFKVGKIWRIHRSELERIVGQQLEEPLRAIQLRGNQMEDDTTLFITTGGQAPVSGVELDKIVDQLVEELMALPGIAVRSGIEAKGEPFTLGAIALKILEVGGLVGLVNILSSWLSRDERRTLVLQLGDSRLEVTGLSTTEQIRLIQWFQTQTGLRIEQ